MKTWSVKIATRLDFMTPKRPKSHAKRPKKKGRRVEKGTYHKRANKRKRLTLL